MSTLSFSSCVALLASFCSCQPWNLSNASQGDERELTFSLSGDDVLECFLGCPVDRTFAVGAITHVVVLGSDPDALVAVRLGSKLDGTAALIESVECRNGTTWREVKLGDACASGETYSVRRAVDIVPARTGTMVLEVIDGDADVVDTLTFSAETPSTIDVDGVRFPGGGALPLSPESSLEVEIGLNDFDGNPLHFDDWANDLTSSNLLVARSERRDVSWFTEIRPSAFVIESGEPGAATLSLDLVATHFDIPIEVIAR